MSSLSRLPRLSLLSLALGSSLACTIPTQATPYPTQEPPEGEPRAAAPELGPTQVAFGERVIDLGPFLEGFPYTSFRPKLSEGRMFVIETGERYTLRELPLPAPGDAITPLELASAAALSEIDWSTRSLWDLRVHPKTNTLWLHADARNDEQMNLWRMDLGASGSAREPAQITAADYIYGWGFSSDEDKAQIAYLARRGDKAPYTTCLRLLDALEPAGEGADREIVCDSPELSFTWSSPHFSPDNNKVYFNAQVEGDRKRVQIVEVDLRRKQPKVEAITDPEVPRNSPGMLEGWAGGEHLLYTSNEDGFGNVYAWSRRTKKHRKLTAFTDNMLGAESLRVGETDAVFVAHGTPAGSTVELLDALSGELLGKAEVPGQVSLLDADEGRVVWSQQAPDKVFEVNLSSFSRPEGKASGPVDLANANLVALPGELESQLVRCEPELVSIPTFDGRELHAFVLRPREPLSEDPAQGVAMVRSFYGGDNSWTRYDHVLCAAGITVVSPSVRGCGGFGREFSALNDRDLGGDEIVDLFWVARWIEAELGIPSARIGVYGRSHGGYATMRAMTFPPETNDRNERYAWGFGLAEAGFSDIVAFHDATNIPDWVVLEAGDPAVPEDRARLEDRSPINHVERLEAPIFLLHGANDWRVPVEGSRAFVAAAEAAGKPVSYHEVEGQGHRIEGQERIVEAWQTRLDFIYGVLNP